MDQRILKITTLRLNVFTMQEDCVTIILWKVLFPLQTSREWYYQINSLQGKIVECPSVSYIVL